MGDDAPIYRRRPPAAATLPTASATIGGNSDDDSLGARASSNRLRVSGAASEQSSPRSLSPAPTSVARGCGGCDDFDCAPSPRRSLLLSASPANAISTTTSVFDAPAAVAASNKAAAPAVDLQTRRHPPFSAIDSARAPLVLPKQRTADGKLDFNAVDSESLVPFFCVFVVGDCPAFDCSFDGDCERGSRRFRLEREAAMSNETLRSWSFRVANEERRRLLTAG